MNFKSLPVFILALGLLCNTGFGQVTNNPKVEEQSAPYVKIRKVELTGQNTVVYLQFIEQGSVSQQLKPFNLPKEFYAGNSIWLDPETRLYKPGETDRKFKLIRAENIPTKSKMGVMPGDTINFVAYFERLTPGIEIFDFYEGRSTQGGQSWNFYGIHIKNPLKKEAAKVAKPAPKAEKPKPAEKPAPIEEPVPDKPKTEPAVAGTITGMVYNAKTREPIPVQISYIEKGDSLEFRSSSGKYRIGLDPAEKYDFRVFSKGYYGTSFRVAPVTRLRDPLLKKTCVPHATGSRGVGHGCRTFTLKLRSTPYFRNRPRSWTGWWK